MAAATMNKNAAEQIFGFTTSYTAEDLHSRYRKLVLTAHPDTGGSEERFVQIGLAYRHLKGFFNENNASIIPECAKAQSKASAAAYASAAASAKATTETVNAAASAGNASKNDSAANGAAVAAAASAFAQARDAYKASSAASNGANVAPNDVINNVVESIKDKRAARKEKAVRKENEMPLIYKIFAHLPYRLLFAAIVIGYTLFMFGGLNFFPNITGICEPSGWDIFIWYMILCPIATFNCFIPFVTAPLRALILKIIEAAVGAKADMSC